MASACIRSASRASLSSLRSCLKPRAAGPPPPAAQFSGATSRRSAPDRRFSPLTRCPSELGCCWGSLLPLHSAVAAARLTSRLSSASRSCRALSQEIGLSVPR